MARGSQQPQNDDLLMGDDITAAFLSEDEVVVDPAAPDQPVAEAENWDEEEVVAGLVLPVPVKEEEIEAVLKDGVLTISFAKLKQDTVKKIQVL